MKKILGILLFSLVSTGAFAGAGGAGNTEDASIQFEFARSIASSIVASVTPQGLFEASGQEAIKRIYTRCRQTLFVGIIRTRFELVEEISDGNGFHAIAQRLDNGTVRISRREMEKLLAAGSLTAPFLTSLVLHEVGHDCSVDGKRLDDGADGLLNSLAEALIRAAGARSASHMIDLDFIENVKQARPVRFLDLSSHVRELLTQKYLDYVGDWAFVRYRSELGDRPAPASQFLATLETSVFPGWAQIASAGASRPLSLLIEDVLAPGFKKGAPAYREGSKLRVLPSVLSCVPVSDPDSAPGSSVSCGLNISWAPLPGPGLQGLQPKLAFILDLFGNLRITQVKISQGGSL
ncbi:MAG TPA: hypothetical protein DCS07_03830 [Bdellovibrionales bacterium]|nr:MAG: hypothetical protein A2X97_05885 [Bdellovibrionales bacterium GWA1_52_35]OFZ41361.1 MAG: hypothetical protein A2070_05225 [Bdellovibrionales bacterium GWC1_52_8]HAR41748.1 hypothetical protein [Bdellovibrionales bacterium]HCM41059.1 hypothetical protein [Bdellovibrionales bacterium]